MFCQELRKTSPHISEGASLWATSVEPAAHTGSPWYDSHRRCFVLSLAELHLTPQSTAKGGNSATLLRRDLWSLYTG